MSAPMTPSEFRQACQGIVPVEYYDWITALRNYDWIKNLNLPIGSHPVSFAHSRAIAFAAMYGAPPDYCEDLLRAWNSDSHLEAFLKSLTAHDQAALLLRLEAAST